MGPIRRTIMGRKARVNYVKVALEVLQELGGGPISTKTMVAFAKEEGLVGDGKWVYHNFSRKVRESDLFNTSVRGEIRLAVSPLTADGFVEETVGEIKEPVEVVEETETVVEQPPVFPGPTLGSGFNS
jgi:hypothetical protein